MKKHVFIINPKAGKGKSVDLIPYIKKEYDNPIILLTKYQNHAKELAIQYANKDSILYSIGGDGTLNEIVNGVARTDATIAVIPCGSGNDFIKTITKIKDPMKILCSYKNMLSKKIDIGQINDRYFINIASIGFDAEIVYNAKAYKKLPLISGELSYLFSTIRTIVKMKPNDVEIIINNRETNNYKILLIAIANGKYYGGGMKPAPNAIIDDGILDICLVNKASKLKVLSLLPKYIKGTHETISEVEFIRANKISIISKSPIPVNIDGEVDLLNNIQVGIIKQGLNILIP